MTHKTWYIGPEQYRVLMETIAMTATDREFQTNWWPVSAARICGYSERWPGPSGDVDLVVVMDPVDLQLIRSSFVDEETRLRAIERVRSYWARS